MGLSIKTIAVQCVTVNICLWRASRFVPIRLLPIMLHEIWCVLVLAAVAFACRELTLMLGLGGIDSLLRFLVSGVVYTLAAALTALLIPQLLGMSRAEMREKIQKLRARLGR